MHDIKPYDRQKFDYTKNKDKIMGIYMRTRSYVRNLKSFHKTLWELHFDNGNFYLISLTFKDDIEFRHIEQRLRTFRTALKRRYGKFEFARAIEVTKKHSYHIHMIAQFNDFPLDLNKNNLPTIICTHFGVAEDDMKGNWWFESCPEHALLGNRKELKKIIKNNENILAVFSGHQHWTKYINEEEISYYILGSMTENINDDGVPDGVYFIVEFDGKNIEVVEKNIRL